MGSVSTTRADPTSSSGLLTCSRSGCLNLARFENYIGILRSENECRGESGQRAYVALESLDHFFLIRLFDLFQILLIKIL
jgi:hypothetical protein